MKKVIGGANMFEFIAEKNGVCRVYKSGQISSRPHTTDFPQKVAKEGKSPYFREI